MITFQSSGPSTAYARTWNYSVSATDGVSGGVSTGTPTSTRASTTLSSTTRASGSGIDGSRIENAQWGTVRSTTRRSGGTSVTFSQTFSFATTWVSGFGLTTRNGTVTGSVTLSPTTYTFQTPTVTTSSNTYFPDPPLTSSTTTRPTTTTVSSSTTVSTATASVTTSLPTTAETTATVSWSLNPATVPITEIGEDTVLFGALTSPLADFAWYPQVTAVALPCAYAYVTPSALTAPTPLSALSTATVLITAPAVGTWTTNATTVSTITVSGGGGGTSQTINSTYNYTFTPASLLGSTYHLATQGPDVAVPRIPFGWQNARSFGTFWPLGTSYTISVATSVTNTDESLLRLAGLTTARDGDNGVFLVWTLNTADTLSLLGTVAVTVNVPIEQGLADPGGGYPDGTAPATVTWPPGIFDVTSVSATLGSPIVSGSYRTTVTAESTQTISPALAFGVRVIPALIPTGTYAPPATYSTNFTLLSSYNETNTGVNAHTWIETTCQPTWPDPGDDDIDGIFD